MVKYITPCSSGDPEGFEQNWMNIPDNIPLLEPILTMTDFLKALRTSKKSVNEEDVKKYREWTEEFGQEG